MAETAEPDREGLRYQPSKVYVYVASGDLIGLSGRSNKLPLGTDLSAISFPPFVTKLTVYA